MAYGYYRTITIDNTKVPGDLTDHPFLFNTTHNDLRVTGSGGHVTSASGYDIVFSASADGSSPYAHEIERYEPTTGEFVAHVKIPSIGSSAPTVFYIVYGDSGVTTSQENVTGAWDADYMCVLHLSGDLEDSTSNGLDWTDHGTGDIAGKIANGRHSDQSDHDYIDRANDAKLSPGVGNYTIELWFKTSFDYVSAAFAGYLFNDYGTDVDNLAALMVSNDDNKLLSHFRDGNCDIVTCSTPGVVNDGDWHRVMWVRDGTTGRLYLDAAAVVTDTDVNLGDIDTSDGQNPALCAEDATPVHSFEGDVDEYRFSDIARSDDYRIATFNNQSDPGAFYTLGSEQSPTAGKNVSDTASGTGALSIAVVASVSDTGAGAGELSITVAAPVSDVGEGTDAVTLVTPIGLSDSGVGAEDIVITVSLAISDSGAGVDSPGIDWRVVIDEGVGADAVSVITVDLAISDTAAGAEDISTVKPVLLSDSGVGSESISITVSLSVADSGAGSEVAAGAIEITEADTATGSESIAIEVAVPVGDDGKGVGTLAIVVVASLTDTAEGTDSLVDDGDIGVIGRGPQDHIHFDTTSAPTQTYHITKWRPISHRMIVIEHSVHGGTIAHALPDLQYRMWEIEMLLTQSELTILRADLAASHLFYFRAIDHSPGHPSEDIIRVYAMQMPSEEFIDPLLQKARVKLVLMEDPW